MAKIPESTRAAFGRVVGPIADAHGAAVVDTDTGSVKRKPQRAPYYNVGIAEAAAVGIAAGLAHAGERAVVVGFSAFITGRAYEFVKLDLAMPQRNVVVVGTHGGATGGWLGPTHHALDDLSLMFNLPHMRVMVPAAGERVGHALATALEHEGPVFLRLGRKPTAEVAAPWGWSDQGWTGLRSGKRVLLVAVGPECAAVCARASDLARAHRDVEVAVAVIEDLHGLPSLAESASDYAHVMVVEDSWSPAPVATWLRWNFARTQVHSRSLTKTFHAPASHETLLAAANIEAPLLAEECVALASGDTPTKRPY